VEGDYLKKSHKYGIIPRLWDNRPRSSIAETPSSTGFRIHKQLRAFVQAHALYRRQTKVTMEDFEKIRRPSKFMKEAALWSRDEHGLKVKLPAEKPSAAAFVLKIERGYFLKYRSPKLLMIKED
jgi:hypothetical protein